VRHVVVFLLLAVAIAWLVTRASKVEELMIPVALYSAEQSGSRFVEIDRALLPVTPGYLSVPGVTTIVYFHDDTCHACVKMDRDLADFLRIRPDVAVRKVSMRVNGDAYHTTIRDFKWKVYVAPSILIFDKKGKLVAADEGTDVAGSDLLDEWMSKEAEKAAVASH